MSKSLKRGSGILLHITSLPSDYYSGDLGPGAYQFVDFLADSGQSYWQILPLCPTNAGVGYSPYSSNSAFAGHHLLISPQELFNKGYLKQLNVTIDNPNPALANFPKQQQLIDSLLREAFNQFDQQRLDFTNFCQQNAWLEDWAIYSCLKDDFQGQSWNNWPTDFRFCNQNKLQTYRQENEQRIVFKKFIQFIFDEQWHCLKSYAQKKGIQIIGDIPIYVSMDSSDVWSQPHIFQLDQNKQPTFVSGVPPDYFSETGQLWGTPVYHWQNLQVENFRWWINRLKRNHQLYDLARIDHFRGLVAYWQVEANQKTAINGSWQDVPIYQFLDTVFQEIPDLQLIAENLGIITEEVEKVRQHYWLPGMKVLQFAFDGNSNNNFLPHTYTADNLVYTGTHDNNTTKGWFKYELKNQYKKQLADYCGKNIYKDNVCEELIRLALSSTAQIAIIPLQDILGEEQRFNKPGSVEGNWQWRYQANQMKPHLEKLFQLNHIYGRM